MTDSIKPERHVPELSAATKCYFDLVFDAMQKAEDIGGPESGDYINLMSAIATEALTRAANCAALDQRCSAELHSLLAAVDEHTAVIPRAA